jgi:RimJ/RimL family protein N-acetyltransferase
MTALPPLNIRPADFADRRSLWDWRNDPVVADLSDLDDAITYEDFANWFNACLERNDIVFAIAHIQSIRVAFARFNRVDQQNWKLDIYIKPAFCGRTMGPQIIREAVAYLQSGWQVNRISSVVEDINPASAYAFIEAGFDCSNKGAEIECALDL